MYSQPIGISVLTNGKRLPYLKDCLRSLLANCYYRPLVIGVFNNGSNDDTGLWLAEDMEHEFKAYGVEFRIGFSSQDLGCAAGTNLAKELVRDCEFALHLESDFSHLSPEESGEDRLWLRRAVEFMQEVGGNFLYLRRMTGDYEMVQHWWAQWMPRITEQRGRFLGCPDFWWSNNPAVCRNKALYEGGTLPLDVSKDGQKGEQGWSRPEMEARAPGRAWIHQWGLFVHDRPLQGDIFRKRACHRWKLAGCKYGFFKDGSDEDRFCQACHESEDFRSMPEHQARREAM